MNHTIKKVGLEALLKIFKISSGEDKKSLLFIFGIICFQAMFELIGLASLLPVVSVLQDNSIIHSNTILKFLWDYLQLESEQKFVLFLISSVVMIFFAKGFFLIILNYWQTRLVLNISERMTIRSYNTILNQTLSFFKKRNSTDIFRYVAGYPTIYANLLKAITFIVTEFIILILIVIGVALYNPMVFLIMILSLFPPTVFFYMKFKKRIGVFGKQINDHSVERMKLFNETYHGLFEIKLFDKVSKSISRFMTEVKSINNKNVNVIVLSLVPPKLVEMVSVFTILVIYIYALMSGVEAEIISILSVFVLAAYRSMPSINRIMAEIVQFKNNRYVLEKLMHVVKLEEKQIELKKGPLKFQDSIEFKNISYSFEDSEIPLFNNFQLKLRKGETVGFIGESGSGKSTLVNLLLNFTTEYDGEILVDGIKISNENIRSWWEKIGLVKQDIFISNRSVAENIALGEEKNKIDIEQLKKAIDGAQLGTLFRDQMNSDVWFPIGESGNNLSGGQKQRIGIARALYRKVDLLVFDEATSALDDQTEKDVLQTIEKLKINGLTILMIAHRLTTLKFCDRIIELDKGMVVNEFNGFKELELRKGI